MEAGHCFLVCFHAVVQPPARLLCRRHPSTRGSIPSCCCSAPVPAGAAPEAARTVKAPPRGGAAAAAHGRAQGPQRRGLECGGGSRAAREPLPWPRPRPRPETRPGRPAAPPVAAVTTAVRAGPRELARRREHGAGSVPLGTGTAPPPW